MRFLLMMVFFGCALVLACKNVEKEPSTLEIETFASSDLEYSTTEVHISDTVQKRFIEKSFLPWNLGSEELLNVLNSFPGKDLSYLEKYWMGDEWYGENKKPHKKWQREEIVENIDVANFPNFLKRGITVAHTDLRRIPTRRPGFDAYSKAGEGYPFDYFQETAVWANTPLLILHISKDKQWCYAITPYYKGWVTMHHVAFVDEDFIAQWSTETYARPLSDGMSLQNAVSYYAINTKIGMLLPYEEISNDPNMVMVYYANADADQKAQILKAEVDKNKVALHHSKFNNDHLERLVSNLAGRPYGWGGNLENRDCSSMIRDLLGTFKIWLPRDSKDQMAVGRNYDLLGTAAEKIKLIKDRGIPFLTILRKKGHNMLYVGNKDDGTPLIFHALWGLKTSYSNKVLEEQLKTYPIEGIHKGDDGQLKGRHIIGEAVITSITLGSGNDGTTVSLIDEIYAMTNILEK